MPGVYGETVPVPVVWDELTTREALDTWTDLSQWMTWVVRRFRLRPKEVPPCWFRHGAAVEELTALWGSYLVSYSEEQSAIAASDWLRILADTRARLAQWMTRCGCTATEHREDPDVTWPDHDPEFRRYVGTERATHDATTENAIPDRPVTP